ncbi:hypothetical protein D3C80_1871330 [compost metagenome]
MTKPNDNSAAVAPERVDVVLTKPHTHAGKDYVPGAKINVTLKQKAFLEEAGVVGKPAAQVAKPEEK